MVLDNFWVTPPSGGPAGQFVWPDDRMASPANWCNAHYTSATNTISWPNLSTANGGVISGVVNVGAHSDFVPAGAAGLSYR